MRVDVAFRIGVRSATGVDFGAKRKSILIFSPCSPVFAINPGSSLQSLKGVAFGFSTGSMPSPLQSSSQKTKVRAPLAAIWTSNGWKMRPARSRQAGSGR